LDANGLVTGVVIGPNEETPGFGKKAEKPNYRNQYLWKTGPFTVVRKGTAKDNEIDSIAGSTITSVGVTDAVNAALEYFHQNRFDLTGGATE
jgi:electron transport complex protein RnfG